MANSEYISCPPLPRDLFVEREEQRLQTLARAGWLGLNAHPALREAVQKASKFLDAPICTFGFLDRDLLWIKAQIGWQKIASTMQLPHDATFCHLVVDSEETIAISDTLSSEVTTCGRLLRQQGVRSYLGVPLFSQEDDCLGTLAVMDFSPRRFVRKEIEFLELLARCAIQQLELDRLRTEFQPPPYLPGGQAIASPIDANPVKDKLVTATIQQLRSPLTSMVGITSVLGSEVYGRLKPKQKEYLGILHDSGRYLLSMLDGVLALRELDSSSTNLKLNRTDVAMLCQQTINQWEAIARREKISLALTVAPGDRIWTLDKTKVNQIVYLLGLRVMQTAPPESILRLHVACQEGVLAIALWIAHPWLGDVLEGTNQFACSLPQERRSEAKPVVEEIVLQSFSPEQPAYGLEDLTGKDLLERTHTLRDSHSLETLGLWLSWQLIELHRGQLNIHGSPEVGYRYMILLPEVLT